MTRANGIGMLRWKLAGILAVVAIAAAACGSSSPSATTAATAEASSGASAAPADSASAAASGGALNVAINYSLDNFDPLTNAGDPFRNSIRLTMFNTLLAYDKDTVLQPSLAESYDVTDDEKGFVFHLRKGVKWHDGKPLTADDVKYTFDRVADKSVGVYYADLLSDIEKVTVVDPETVQVDLKTTSAGFLDALINMSIVQKDSGDSDRTNPIGTGPFKFSEFVPNEKLVLVKNTDYFESGVPTLDTLTFLPITDSQVALQNLQGGTVDYVMDIPPALVPTVEGNSELTLVNEPTTGMTYIDFFSKNMPSTDPRIRQAMVMCLDYSAVDKVVYNGIGKASQNILPEGTWAYSPIQDYAYDPAAAKKLLADAGYPDGFKITLDGLQGYDAANQVLTIWQQGLKECGIDAEIRVQEFNAWLDAFFKHTLQVSIDIDQQGPDPNRFFNISFVGPHAGGGDAVSQELLDVGKQANETLDQAERKTLYAKYAELAHGDLHATPVYRNPLLAATKPSVSGVVTNRVGFYQFDRATVGQ